MAKRFDENMGDDALRAATGRGHAAWHDLLDAAGAREWTHTATARWLVAEHEVSGWWAQGITVGYEQSRKGRAPGQQADGTFSTQKAKTIPGRRLEALARVEAVVAARHGAASGRNLTAAMPVVRWRLSDGTRLAAAAGAENKTGTPITLTHDKLTGDEDMATAKAAIAAFLDEAAGG